MSREPGKNVYTAYKANTSINTCFVLLSRIASLKSRLSLCDLDTITFLWFERNSPSLFIIRRNKHLAVDVLRTARATKY